MERVARVVAPRVRGVLPAGRPGARAGAGGHAGLRQVRRQRGKGEKLGTVNPLIKGMFILFSCPEQGKDYGARNS